MSNYYVLEFRNYRKNASRIKAATYDANGDEVEDIFDDGVSLKNTIKPPFTAIINERPSDIKKELMDRMQYRGNVGNIWLISAKAQETLDALDLPVEFIPITIKGKKVTMENYHLVNVIGKINCLDFEKSDIKYDEDLGYVERYMSLVLDETKIPEGTDVFLLGEDITMLVIVSKRVKEAVEAAGLTGFVFVHPKDYSTFTNQAHTQDNMSNYYVLEFRDYHKNASLIKAATYDANGEEVDTLFYEGTSIQDKIESPFTAIINERPSDIKKVLMDRMQFNGNAGDIWLISAKAQAVLAALNLPVEFIPITVKGKKVTMENYYLVNVIGKIECLDFEKSDIKYNERLGYVKRFMSIVLDETKIPEGSDVFLLGEKLSMLVIVSKRIKEAVEAAGLTGFVFLEPKDYSTFTKPGAYPE